MAVWPERAFGGDPSLRWQTLETAHFRIHFYQGQLELAERLAKYGEFAHEVLSKMLRHTPSKPTHIVLTDDVDSANGSAQVVPYNLIRLFATPPGSQDLELLSFDDWMRLLVTHEYTHILHMDTSSGIATIVNGVLGLGLGRVYSPNQIQPRWFLEGFATFEETRQTGHGRLGSSVFEMYLRSRSLETGGARLDRITSGTLEFPHGSTAYLYGSYFLAYIADRFGADVLTKVSHNYGGAAIPFGLNRAVAEVTGVTYEALWRDFEAALAKHVDETVARVIADGETASERLTFHGETTSHPGMLPPAVRGGPPRLLYVRQDGYDRTAVMALALDGARAAPKEIYRMEAGGRVVAHPRLPAIVTSEPEVCRTYYVFNDLFWVDLPTGRRRRLTSCERALDPEISPDGRWVAYIRNESGGRGGSLRIRSLDEPQEVVELVTSSLEADGKPSRQVYTPTWSPDGKHLLFSTSRPGGGRSLVLMDVVTRKEEELFAEYSLSLFPRFDPSGPSGPAGGRILFSNDRSGIFNIYALDVNSRALSRVTNVRAGAFQPVVVPLGMVGSGRGELVYQGFTSRGYDLYRTAYEPSSFVPVDVTVPLEERAFISRYGPQPAPRPGKVTPGEIPDVPMSVRSYSPWSTIHPWRVGNIDIVPGPFSQLLALDFSGADAVGMHQWHFRLEQGLSGRGETNFSADYVWDRLWAPISASFGHRTGRLGDISIDGAPRPYAESQWNATIAATLPIVRRISHNLTLQTDYHYTHFSSADGLTPSSPELLDPNAAIVPLPGNGSLAGFGFRLSFTNLRRYLYSVTPQEGRALGLGLVANQPALGGSQRSIELSWNYSEYLSLGRSPRTRRHVLLLGYSGGVGASSVGRRGVFALGGFGDTIPYSTMLLCALTVKRQGDCGGGTPTLRGYAPGSMVGDQYHLVTAEFRMPIADLETGSSTLPVYATRLVGAAYSDIGLATFGRARLEDLRVGVGAELGLNFVLGYSEGGSFRVGYARGLMAQGDNQVYLQFRLSQLY